MKEKEPKPFLGPDKGGDFGGTPEMPKEPEQSESSKEELPLPADIASYKYHHLSTYLQRLVFDRYQRKSFINDFELKDDPASDGTVVTWRLPII